MNANQQRPSSSSIDLLVALSKLPTPELSLNRAEQIRRCAKERLQSVPLSQPVSSLWATHLEPLLVGSCASLYLAWALATVNQLCNWPILR